MIDQRRRIFAVKLWLLDLVLTTVSFFLAYFLRLGIYLEGRSVLPVQDYLWLLALILPIWALLLPLFGVYSELMLPPPEQIIRLTKAILFAGSVFLALQFLIGDNVASRHRLIAALTIGVSYLLLVALRLFTFKKHGSLDVRHVAVVGAGSPARDFARKIEDHRSWGFKLLGVFGQEDVRELVVRGGVDEVIIVADREPLEVFTETFLLCEEMGVTARFVLNCFPHSIARTELHQFAGLPLLSFTTTPTNETLMLVRRALDILVTALVALPVLILLAASAIAIKLSSPGPILFVQERCGLNGRLFRMYKLRSMVDNAEQARAELESLNEMSGPVFKVARDPRITTIGRLLRRFSIDELPQFYNVLRGDMSLVGPRPPLPGEVARYERWQRRRLSMKPGLTCLWQISGRNEVGFQDWMKLDLAYIDNWSLLLDLKILIKTLPVVLLGRGAR